jgi:outer membrane biosynthesis protein TonB
MAFSTSKPIFPVRQSDIQPAAGLAFFLKIRHWTDAFGKHGDAAMERLGIELDALCGAPKAETVAAPPPPAAQAAAPLPQPAPQPQAPAPPPSAVTPAATLPPAGAGQEERLAAAIGPNAAWYLERWRRMEANGSSLSWNWPAFLASIFWFAHRKMWLPLAAGVALFFLASFIAGRGPAFVLPAWLLLLALAALSGAIGNMLYRRQVTALVAKADGLDQPVALAQVRAQGGVSVPGLVSSLAIFALLVLSTVVQMNRARAPANLPAPPAGQQVAPAQAEQPAEANPPQPEQPALAGVSLDAAYLVGRWSDGTSGCDTIFNNDSTFSSDDGSRGLWNLTGDRLTLTGNSTMILQVQPTDANTMTLVKPDGSLIRATRC